jgi:hypothetical protein
MLSFNPLFLIILILLFGVSVLKAQDTLILNDGSEMHVKVLEIAMNTISYKKPGNSNETTYTIHKANIFMVVYKNGSREIFTTKEDQSQVEKIRSNQVLIKQYLQDDFFELKLLETKSIPDKNKKSVLVTAKIEVSNKGRPFTSLSVTAYQRTDAKLDFSNPKGSYLSKSSLTIYTSSDNINELLFQKYEKYSGKGLGWALPPDFFSLQNSICSIAFLQQKGVNTEIVGFGGITATKINLKDCTSLESKLLSAALIWLQKNFENK